MAFTHGIIVNERPTSIIPPITANSAIQVVIGAAPININGLSDLAEPQLCYNYDEAVSRVGISRNFNKWPLMQSLAATFEIYNVAPIIFINVAQKSKHTKSVKSEVCQLQNGQAILANDGVYLDSVKLKVGATALVKGTDYTAAFDTSGNTVIKIIQGEHITEQTESLTAEYSCIDPSMVSSADILDGIKRVREIYPRFNLIPGLLLAPGHSHKVEVYNALCASARSINGQFKCMAIADADCSTIASYDEVNAWKNKNSFVDNNSIIAYPAVRYGESIFHYSTILAAHMAQIDAEHEDIPYMSPSNHMCKISGLCNAAGGEIILDIEQATLLNSQGVVTAINQNGWRVWGNHTAGYPATTDVKDVFIPVRRMFLWWGNTFILTYFQKVDNPMNKRLIESIVDSENIRANGFKARGIVADAQIEFRIEENPVTDLLNGTIRFRQYLTPFTPAQTIINELEFDPNALVKALGDEN